MGWGFREIIPISWTSKMAVLSSKEEELVCLGAVLNAYILYLAVREL